MFKTFRRAGVDPSVVSVPVRRVAIVGNELSPGQPGRSRTGRYPHGLGGACLAARRGRGLRQVAEADRTGTNPGTALRTLIERYAPAVILVDEWVAYARGLYGNDELVGGSFESQFTFAQQLTQAVTAVPGALLLVSIPAVRRAT